MTYILNVLVDLLHASLAALLIPGEELELLNLLLGEVITRRFVIIDSDILSFEFNLVHLLQKRVALVN